MADKSPTTANGPAAPVRLDPSHSKVFSWLEWNPDAPATFDARGRTIQPETSILHVRYRYNGAEWVFWPVNEEEARKVMNPGPEYGFSIGSAFSQIIKAHKSGRLIKSGERQETKKQREEIEQRSGRKWLA